MGNAKGSLHHCLIPPPRNRIQAPPTPAGWYFPSVFLRGGPGVCVHLCVLAFPQLCALLACWLLATLLEAPPALVSHSGALGMAPLWGAQPDGGLTHLLTAGFRVFSSSTAQLRNCCLSENQCPKSVVHLFVRVLINGRASALSVRGCRAPPREVGRQVALGIGNVSLCFQRGPGGQCAGHLQVQDPDAVKPLLRPSSSESYTVLALQLGA